MRGVTASGRVVELDEDGLPPPGLGEAVYIDFDSPMSKTPPQDWLNDTTLVDRRPIRSLDEQEVQAIRLFAARGAYAAIAGFECWRGGDRYLYTDVLGVSETAGGAAKIGMPVGPIDESWIGRLRMVGDQLALRGKRT